VPAADTRRRRALIVVENAGVPGDRRVWNEALSLRDADWEVTVLAPRFAGRAVLARERLEQIMIERFPVVAGEGGPASYVREYVAAAGQIARRIHRLARPHPFDVIQFCNPPDFLLLMALPERRRGTALIFDHHDLVPEMVDVRFGAHHRRLRVLAEGNERLAYRLADVVLTTNESIKRVAVERGERAAEDVFVVRNGPRLRSFTPLPTDPGIARGRRFLLAYVGLMACTDGVELAIQALAHLHDRRRDWHAVFLGDGEMLPALQRLTRTTGLEDHVEFRGPVEHQEVRRTLSRADLGLAPDPPNLLTHASTLVKIPEYLALRCPVVSFDLHESRVSAGDAAVYARGSDTRDFARLIDQLLDDEDRRLRMAAEGRRRIEARLAWEHSEQRLLTAYERAVERATRRVRPPVDVAPVARRHGGGHALGSVRTRDRRLR
jgi:glycosyltransferase involved in cell wall biosynthesis